MTTTFKKITTQTFNRFGVKKTITFNADNGQELAYLARMQAAKVAAMSMEQYLAL